MAIYPHPDDETMAAGGLLLTAKVLGYKTVVVCLTKGGAGKMHVHPNDNSTKEIREKELRKAAKILKVDELVLGDFDDGKLREQKEGWLVFVEEAIRKYRPGIIVTYDLTGLSGHPDHISLSLGVRELVKSFKEIELFWTSASEYIKTKIVREELRRYVSKPEYKLTLGIWEWQRKWRAARAHKSQALGKGLRLSLGILLLWQHFEWYHKVELSKDYPYKFVEFKI